MKFVRDFADTIVMMVVELYFSAKIITVIIDNIVNFVSIITFTIIIGLTV